jgi:hypothetical protein
MATRAEQAAFGAEHDARVLDEAARIIRRRIKSPEKPAGASIALFCRTLTTEASMCRSEARAIRAESES